MRQLRQAGLGRGSQSMVSVSSFLTQIVDNSVKMTFHGNDEPEPVSFPRRLKFIKASSYEGMCNCECNVRE